jgi:multiple sugar transport system ATP-binding protein
MAEIRIERVTKRYPDGTVPLRDASFTVHDGEFFILVGPSGCGKSTLLNMIVGLVDVTEGEILVDDVCVNDLDPKDRNMAMVFQSYAIYPHMSVRENLAFPLRMAKLGKEETARRVNQAAAILELQSLLDRKPATLSGGQRQRVAMGRAIVREPKAFLLDEPLSNLDAKLRVQMRAEISRLQKRLGATMVYVTHDQTEAMTLGDRVAVLNRGRVQQVGTPKFLYEEPANLFVASFLGSPAMNFLPAKIDGSRVILPVAEFEMTQEIHKKIQYHTGSLWTGVRPEQIQHAESASSNREFGLVFEATAEVVEWLGPDAYVHFRAPFRAGGPVAVVPEDLADRVGSDGGGMVTARIDPAFNVREGDKIRFGFDCRKLHWFDGKSGDRLGS